MKKESIDSWLIDYRLFYEEFDSNEEWIRESRIHELILNAKNKKEEAEK